jgi:hypothetical protein
MNCKEVHLLLPITATVTLVVNFIKPLGYAINIETIETYYDCNRFGDFIKNSIVSNLPSETTLSPQTVYCNQ